MRWLTLPWVGTGTAFDPRRPDLKGVGGIHGYNVAADAGTGALVLVARDRPPLDELKAKAGVLHVGDDTDPDLRARLDAECARLGVLAVDPAGYRVGEG